MDAMTQDQFLTKTKVLSEYYGAETPLSTTETFGEIIAKLSQYSRYIQRRGKSDSEESLLSETGFKHVLTEAIGDAYISLMVLQQHLGGLVTSEDLDVYIDERLKHCGT